MTRTAMRAVVVAGAGPSVRPVLITSVTGVMVEKPGPASLLRSQTIITTRNEIDKSAIAQILKLLTYLWLDVLVAGIEIAKMTLERVDLVEHEFALPKRLHAFH